MSEKQEHWDPKAPATTPPLGAYHAQPAMQPGVQPGMQPVMQPGMHMQPGIVVPMTQMATPNFCPATGGAHTPEESTGIIGIIVGIVFCPIGLIACCLDKKITCRNCRFVIQPGWGGA